MGAGKRLVIFSQVYVPDAASVGQHLHDAAAEMVRRGWSVSVYTSARGYENPERRYPRCEDLDGVLVRRLPASSFGKATVGRRILGGLSFVLQCLPRGLFGPRPTTILISTSPPFAGLLGVVVSLARRCGLAFWAMDINPDQLVAVGAVKPSSVAVRFFDWANRLLLRRSHRVVALDRFMRETLERKARLGSKVAVMPPWPHFDELEEPLSHAENAFRVEQGWGDSFVVMYSGNLSPVHPLWTLMEAARALVDRERFKFVFIGGGLGREQIRAFVEQHDLSNVVQLPYQPLERLRESLSAADVHVVSVGEPMVGIVHPCKIYGALAVGRPVLAIAPQASHVGDILASAEVGSRVDHGDVAGCVARLEALAALDQASWQMLGRRAQEVVAERFSKRHLMDQFCEALEESASAASNA